MFALKYAALAPVESGWQPWHFRMTDTHLELLAKHSPAREEADPDRREFVIGCGSALQYLKLALKHFGCLGRVEPFPDLGQPALVARVHFGFGRERDAQEKLFFNAMTRSRTNRSPLGGTPVSETMLAALSRAAAGERGWLDFVQSETSRRQVLKITLAGNQWRVSFDRPDIQSTNASVEENTSRRSQPFSTFGGHNADGWNMTEHHSEFSTATLAVVKTKTDDKHWLAGGGADDGTNGFAGAVAGPIVGLFQSGAPPGRAGSLAHGHWSQRFRTGHPAFWSAIDRRNGPGGRTDNCHAMFQ